MDADAYQELAMRTANGQLADHEDSRLLNAALGLAGEAGEICDHIKKFAFQGHELDHSHLVNELGDVCWYIALMCDTLGADMSEVLEANVAKLLKRYPQGFSAEASINREG